MPASQSPAAPVPPELGKIVAAIGLGANILGLFCLYDALRQGLGAYQYHTAIPLLAIYKGVLGIYVAARQAHQWGDPEAAPARGGQFFVLAWVGLYVLLNALELGRLWNPPPIQPAELNNTLNWVLGYYVLGKASALARSGGLRPFGLGRALGRAARGGDGPQPFAAVLSLCADVLGALCIFDVLREAVTPPNLSCIDIHFAYRVVLAALAGTSQWRKWAHDSSSTSLGLSGPGGYRPQGFWWVGAWVGVAVLIKSLEMISSDNLLVMPQHLAGTVLCVCSIYGLGRVADAARKGRELSAAPSPPPAARPAVPAPLPAPKPAEPAAPPAEGSGGSDDDSAGLELMASACEEAGDFSPADIERATGLDRNQVKRRLETLMRRGWIERAMKGRYHWKGRYDVKGGR